MAEIKGLAEVISNLNKEIEKIEGGTLKGLIRAGIAVTRDTEETSPITPLDIGNLRASRFMVTSDGKTKDGDSPEFSGKDKAILSSGHGKAISNNKALAKAVKQPTVILGFSANYAFIVHESVDKNYKRPGSGGKYLESSLNNQKANILKIIAEEAKII